MSGRRPSCFDRKLLVPLLLIKRPLCGYYDCFSYQKRVLYVVSSVTLVTSSIRSFWYFVHQKLLLLLLEKVPLRSCFCIFYSTKRTSNWLLWSLLLPQMGSCSFDPLTRGSRMESKGSMTL
jgi:hypothetical protein